MSVLRKLMDKPARLFEKGGKLEKLYPLWEAVDTFAFTPGTVTRTASHIRDGLDLKRLMITVVVALIPCTVMAMYNTGLQANMTLDPAAIGHLEGWRHAVMQGLGFGYDAGSFLACLFHGLLYFLPVYIVTLAVGGAWETLFAVVRKHEINEGFLVTSLLFPLVLPPTIPLWQVAVGITFGVVIGKEIFGGVGMNLLNPALTARAFLYFAYPAQISGDKVWTAVDGYSGATALAVIKDSGLSSIAPSGLLDWNLTDGKLSWLESFIGIEPGSMGETSALFCIFGAAVLVLTGVGSWRTMAGILVGAVLCSLGLNAIGSETNPAFALPFHWHLVIGGLAFGTVFMATDPVSSPFTHTGKWVYGALIGVLIILMRVVNPAYPETVMLVILLMNVFAPLIDYFVIQANVKRRAARYAA
ncbi:MAG: NADH:ubiquinone reductase (Na(+)-transporting) subunit B [Candidatus Hydrogenedentes bacterium]|nr:NADH:ubiquinone reductase (Na(+)-transporting) subunit B [Candidatus Hydrogenedentota bacterium]